MSLLVECILLSTSFSEAVKRTEAELNFEMSRILANIKSIKDKMLDLEKKISVEEQPGKIHLESMLKRKSSELNRISDSMVSISRDAWVKFNELSEYCKSECGDSAQLEPIRVFCKHIDVIAADLLCFSLGH
jgi:hypothetical protein